MTLGSVKGVERNNKKKYIKEQENKSSSADVPYSTKRHARYPPNRLVGIDHVTRMNDLGELLFIYQLSFLYIALLCDS